MNWPIFAARKSDARMALGTEFAQYVLFIASDMEDAQGWMPPGTDVLRVDHTMGRARLCGLMLRHSNDYRRKVALSRRIYKLAKKMAEAGKQARCADRLIRESKAEWPKHVSAASYPQKWGELFADVEPGADLRVWTMDLERGIAYGPGGIVIA